MNSLVSVIIPVYNEVRYLNECIQSILNQSYTNIELLLVDDGSTNQAAENCDKWEKADSRIRVIHQENQGLSSARVNGLQASKGSWVMFVDDDDCISPYMVEEMLTSLAKVKEPSRIEIVTGGAIETEIVDVKFEKLAEPTDRCFVEKGKYICQSLATDRYQNMIVTPLWGKLYRRSFLEKMDLTKYKKACPTIFFEDVLMTPILFYYADHVLIINKPYYIHREVSDSISRSGKICSFYYEQIESCQILLRFYKKKRLKELYCYELAMLMRTILRIWCLMDTDKKTEKYQKEKYKKDILDAYNQYRRQYMKIGTDTIKNKIVFGAFRYSKILWKVIIQKCYYRQPIADILRQGDK